MRVTCVRLLLAMLLAIPVAPSASPVQDVEAATSVETDSGLRVMLGRDGSYEITTSEPSWTFRGRFVGPLTSTRASNGEDAIGRYREVAFERAPPDAQHGAIRAYQSRSIVLFSLTQIAGATNTRPFATINAYPPLPYRLSFRTEPFSPYQFNTFNAAADSPWLFFDDAANGFVLSAADNFMVARTWQTPDGGLANGIAPEVAFVPAGFTHRTVLVVGAGLNTLFETWGSALTSLHGKQRLANDADLTLQKLGYWTDAGAAYYYRSEPALGYAGTLLAAVAEVRRRGVQLGYLQLDSWFYPKGATARWDDTGGGVFVYQADQRLFPDGLLPFQQAVGLPLVTHARWIDAASPYRQTHAISGNVAVDARYWDETMTYLKSSGVVTYEQDWLGAHAQPSSTSLNEPEAFMSNLAQAAADHGLTLQFCMALPRHFLQGARYESLTSIRVSDDRFDRSRWDTFLYGSRLATALGTWPWSDVFFSAETHNLLLAVLSGGVVGIGDPIGAIDSRNLLRAARVDGVIVKPDSGLVPIDATYVAEAQGLGPPMLASASTDHDGMRAVYTIAYRRGPSAAQSVSLTLADLGLSGAAFVYEPLSGSGRLIDDGEPILSRPVQDLDYVMVAPLGQSGMTFLGDLNLFVSRGRQRVQALVDDGVLDAVIEFGLGETSVRLGGYAPEPPTVTSPDAFVGSLVYEPTSGLFSFVLAPAPGQRIATLSLSRPWAVSRYQGALEPAELEVS